MQPANPQSAKSYELTPFGYILSLSCTPTPGKLEDYFEKPSAKSQQERQATTDYLWKVRLKKKKKQLYQSFSMCNNFDIFIARNHIPVYNQL